MFRLILVPVILLNVISNPSLAVPLVSHGRPSHPGATTDAANIEIVDPVAEFLKPGVIRTGEDAIAFFAKNGTATDLKFVYCVRNTPENRRYFYGHHRTSGGGGGGRNDLDDDNNVNNMRAGTGVASQQAGVGGVGDGGSGGGVAEIDAANSGGVSGGGAQGGGAGAYCSGSAGANRSEDERKQQDDGAETRADDVRGGGNTSSGNANDSNINPDGNATHNNATATDSSYANVSNILQTARRRDQKQAFQPYDLIVVPYAGAKSGVRQLGIW